MNAGALFIATTRVRVNTTSSAVTGLPDANLRPAFNLNVVVSPSLDVSHRSASSGRMLVGSLVSGLISFS